MTSTNRTLPRDYPLLVVENVTQTFDLPNGQSLQALAGVSFDLMRGETLGLVGESGCGKSTTVRAILQAPPPSSGQITMDGIDLASAAPAELRSVRRRMQLVFQDPHSSLNPRWTARKCLLEPLNIHRVGSRTQRQERVEEIAELVGLDRALLDLRPGQLSGGQCQRVGIARALALDPDIVLFDEAVSSLDASVQAQILNLVATLQQELGLTALFIAHDLAVVNHVSDRIGVMYLGKLCELGPADQVLRSPIHPYTAALRASIPQPVTTGRRQQGRRLEGEPPSPSSPPSGCRFRTRCPLADAICAQVEPPMRSFGNGRFAACHHPSPPQEAVEIRPDHSTRCQVP